MEFFQALDFTSSNEDGRTELAALAGARRILCLTASGTRPLDLLLSDAEEIVALDLNPVQNALLDLKIAAIRSLDREDYLAFLGVTPSATRLATYGRIRADLAPGTRRVFDARQKQIRAGIWYAGRYEKAYRVLARGGRIVRRGAIDRLFAARTLEQQAQIWDAEFDDWLWRHTIRFVARRRVWGRITGDPSSEFFPAPEVLEERMAGAIARAARTFFFRDSDMASLFLRGRHVPNEALPVHMEVDHYQTVRNGLERLRIVTGDLCGLHTAALGFFDGFSLSDFGAFCDPAAYETCWRSVCNAATTGARFCERTFINPLPLPLSEIQVDAELSAALTKADRAVVYDIRAGTIAAGSED